MSLKIRRDGQNAVVTLNGTEYTFQGPFTDIEGSYTTHVKGKELPVLIASKPLSVLKLDVENPRTAHDKEKINGNYSAQGQKHMQEYLLGESPESPSQLAQAAKSLGQSIDFHGGQNEFVWVARNVVFEGNRRLSVFKKKNFDNILCLVYPDQTTEEEEFAIKTQRHIAGPLEWCSYVKAKDAHKALYDFGWPLETVAKHFQFSSERDAIKYIHSYVWFAKSGLDDISEWSKFHHAYVPTLVSHFGYNPATATFEPNQRTNQRPDCPLPIDVDAIAGRKTDFEWFVDLIKSGRLTDCRQSDGAIAKLVREADKPWGERAFHLLHQTPVAVKTKGGRGRPKTSLSPAQQCMNYLHEQNQDAALKKQAEKLRQEIESITRSKTKQRAFQANTADNFQLRTELESLFASLDTFIDVLPGRQARMGQRQAGNG